MDIRHSNGKIRIGPIAVGWLRILRQFKRELAIARCGCRAPLPTQIP
jgi:hypothetical protein